MFGLFKKKKQEEPVEQERPNGIPGTAVQIIMNPYMKNIERLDINLDASSCDIHKLTSSITSLLKKKRIPEICVSGEGLFSGFEEIKEIFEIAAAYNIDRRMIFNRGSGAEDIPIGKILDYGINTLIVEDPAEKAWVEELADKEERELKVVCSDGESCVPEVSDRPCGKGRFSQKLDDVRYISVHGDGTVKVCGFPIGNLFESDLIDIIEEYDPYSNPIMAMILQNGPDAVVMLCAGDEASMEKCDRCRAVAARLFS